MTDILLDAEACAQPIVKIDTVMPSMDLVYMAVQIRMSTHYIAKV